MKLWYDYRAAWSHAPWVWPIGLAGVLLFIAGVIGTVAGTAYAFAFVPGLLLILAHHFLALRQLE